MRGGSSVEVQALVCVLCSCLLVIRAEDDPATETVAEVDDPGAADEADDVWERCPEGQDEDLESKHGSSLRPKAAEVTIFLCLYSQYVRTQEQRQRFSSSGPGTQRGPKQ